MKKRKAFLPLLSFVIISSLTSCGSSVLLSTHKINFYDGSTLLGSIEGQITSELSEADKTIVEGYEIKNTEGLSYTFDGWYTSSDFSGQKTNVNYYPTIDMDLYGKYLANVTITLKEGDTAVKTYSGIQGNPVTEKDNENNVVLATFPAPTSPQEKSTFEGWAYKTGDTYTVFDPSIDKFPSENLILTPYYSAWPILTFVSEDDISFSQTLSVEPDEAIVLSDSFKNILSSMISGVISASSSNKEFDAWYSNYDNTTGKYSDPFAFSSGTDVSLTLHARFKTKHTYRIESDLEGYDFDAYEAKYFESDTLAVPVIDSARLNEHYLDGFYTDNTYSPDKLYSFKKDGKMPDSDFTLYAHFIENPTIIIIDKHNTTNNSSFKAEPGTKIDLTTKEHDYSSEHYHFKCFSASEDPTAVSSYISDPQEYIISKTGATIYAHYEMDSKIEVQYIDPYGSSIPGTTIELYAKDGDILPSIASDAEILTAVGSDYIGSKIACFTSDMTSRRAINLPYTVDGDTTLYAVIARPVSLYFEIDYYENRNDASYSNLGSVDISSFQNETIGTDTNAINLLTGTAIKIYGETFDTSVTDFCTKYVFYKAYKGTSEISLPQSNMPKVDLGTSSEPIHIVFVPNEI